MSIHLTYWPLHMMMMMIMAVQDLKVTCDPVWPELAYLTVTGGEDRGALLIEPYWYAYVKVRYRCGQQ